MRAVLVGGRVLGALAGALLSVAWTYAIWFPSGGLTLAGPSIIVAGLMALLALFAAIASLKGHKTVVLLIFIASFLPVGGYLLGVDHWLRWLGVLDLLLLAAAVLIWWGARGRAEPS
jgi:hypothetical protein